jgi:nitrate reductase gamma subunit
VGTFLSFLLFFLVLFNFLPGGWINLSIGGLLTLTGLSGFSILIKRFINKELRALSNPDDYISNILVTIFQFITAYLFFNGISFPLYFILTGVLFLYLPLGKLKHTVYFFAARYHLGFFYGWRGVWPPK